MNEIWIVTDCENESGAGSIKGIFDTQENAKLFLASYVLSNQLDTSFLELNKMKVQVSI